MASLIGFPVTFAPHSLIALKAREVFARGRFAGVAGLFVIRSGARNVLFHAFADVQEISGHPASPLRSSRASRHGCRECLLVFRRATLRQPFARTTARDELSHRAMNVEVRS